MRATSDDYYRVLLSLRPKGPAWAEDDNDLRGHAEELARTHNRAVDLLDEADPRSTLEMLAAWERVCALPDDCTPAAVTLAERRDAIAARLASRGGQSSAYYIGVAAALGYSITITEFRPFTCESECEDPAYDETWRFAFQVNAPETTIRDFTVESPCDEPLRSWGNEILECRINALKPAHSYARFAYGG